MNPNRILDELFSTRSNVAVLRQLNNAEDGWTGRKIARLVGMSAPSCHQTLTYLEGLKIILRKRGGRDHLFGLNREHFLVDKVIIPMLNSENLFTELLIQDLKAGLDKSIVSMFSFSRIKSKEKDARRNLNICFVLKSHSDKKKIEEENKEIQLLFKNKYGMFLKPLYFSEESFKKNARIKKSSVADIIADGTLMFGKSVNELLESKKTLI